MYSSIQIFKKIFSFYINASNKKGHGMHSPFVFDFIRNVLNNNKNYNAPSEIEDLRKELKKNKNPVRIEDLGAGSRTGKNIRTVSQIVSSAAKPKHLAEIMFRLACHYQPKNVVELGTSLGLTTAYLAKAVPNGKIITIEGSPEIHKIAVLNFQKLGLKNVESLQGNFDSHLPSVIHHQSSVSLAFIDGNHRYEPTMRYFHELLKKTGPESIFVFDDIHWSAEMEKAWEEIKAYPSVQYTIDIFYLGFVFFREEFKVKQNFNIRF